MFLWVKARGCTLCDCKTKLICTYVLYGSFTSQATHTPIYVGGSLKYNRSMPAANTSFCAAYWAEGITQSVAASSVSCAIETQ